MPEGTEHETGHEPVLLAEVLGWLRAGDGGVFVDCTTGLGGHSEAILESSRQAEVIGLDRDQDSLELASERLKKFGKRFSAIHANFKELKPVLDGMGINQVAGILADLGISSYQLQAGDRGFSFQAEAPLDMRMDRTQEVTAADLVNTLPEAELADLVFKKGDERGARRIARAIVSERRRQPVTTTTQLAQIVVRALNVPGRWRIHPATRTFQALRIAVNGELEGLSEFVLVAAGYLRPSGRLAIISFHSLEDAVVKRAFRLASGQCQCEPRRPGRSGSLLQSGMEEAAGGSAQSGSKDGTVVCYRCRARNLVRVLTKKPIQPGDAEIRRNPRARSARLRVCERSD
jgi:16S rRNA (cytosine1402-N4)-methyltransferase